MAEQPKLLKIYMSFSLPVDPASVKTLVDLDISYALGSTLVDWTEARHLTDGLAKQQDEASEKQITFKLRPEAKWSDGSQITAVQVVRSFARAKKLHGADLKSLFETVETIEARDQSSVVFTLNRPVAKSMILHKLTEPMYAVLFVRTDDSLDLSKTSGPFTLKSHSTQEISLALNPHWFGREAGMPEGILIRPPKKNPGGGQGGFLEDPWPNVVASSSLISKDVTRLYEKEHFSIWNRNLDRLFFLSPSPRLANASGRQLFQALNHKLDRTLLLKDLSGYHLSDQFFPSGYVIFDPEFKRNSADVEVPEQFRARPIEILAAEGRLNSILKENLTRAIKQVTGHTPHFILVPLGEFNKARETAIYDVLASSLPVNDPNVEGAVSFFFGMTPALIPDSVKDGGDFKNRIANARSLEESKRNADYRKVFSQSVYDGCLLPLFHFSSMVIARDGIDLSRVPTSDETVAFSKVRFK